MSKVDHILASNERAMQAKTGHGLRSSRARILLVALVALLTAFVFFTQPEVVRAIESLVGQIPGF
ncbi:hypothetical protein [Ruegeria sp.]|uniref:hypothetical protein n=1 Tax=Ruegeria sp. TaxID=1879320 RepID=UPI00230E2E38|nr:hypothetical protein [Ruegeria sp.]MDA7964656.1 hypothetical protein [Ruegeria sp.]